MGKSVKSKLLTFCYLFLLVAMLFGSFPAPVLAAEEGAIKLKEVRTQLGELNPKYFSVTFGAGGSTQQGTLETVVDIKEAGFEAAPHISCIGTRKDTIRQLLDTYREHGIKHLVALRGDMPSGAGSVSGGEFSYANELVAFIRQAYGDYFFIEVAAYPEFHPQARSPRDDLENFRRKVEAGANSALTQYFFNPDAYFRFIEDCEKLHIDIPIEGGIVALFHDSQTVGGDNSRCPPVLGNDNAR